MKFVSNDYTNTNTNPESLPGIWVSAATSGSLVTSYLLTDPHDAIG